MPDLEKNIWIFWYQGWDKAPWLVKQVAESWKINNPEWKIILLSEENLFKYVNDIPYVFNTQKTISIQAFSDIVRLSLLKNYGGVWADATLLCLQPLDSWVHKACESSDFWTYHTSHWGKDKSYIPASWFLTSKKGSELITKWKHACDQFWNKNNSTINYHWMNELFVELYKTDSSFKKLWDSVYDIDSEDYGQSHALYHNDAMVKCDTKLKKKFLKEAPYVLKYWVPLWESTFPNSDSEDCKQSNGYYAILLSKLGNLEFNHFI